MAPEFIELADLMERFGLSARTHDKPRVAVSACLLGQKVRYDGDHKHDLLISGELGAWFELVPLCPEVGIGLPVPRPPIQVTRQQDTLRVVGVDNPEVDVTDALKRHALEVEGAIDGLILKARSPSCGVGSTPVYQNGQDTGERTDGLFAAALHQRFPALARRDEEALRDTQTRYAFVIHCHLYRRWRDGRADSEALAHWQDLCFKQGSTPFQQLGERLQHWRGRA